MIDLRTDFKVTKLDHIEGYKIVDSAYFSQLITGRDNGYYTPTASQAIDEVRKYGMKEGFNGVVCFETEDLPLFSMSNVLKDGYGTVNGDCSCHMRVTGQLVKLEKIK